MWDMKNLVFKSALVLLVSVTVAQANAQSGYRNATRPNAQDTTKKNALDSNARNLVVPPANKPVTTANPAAGNAVGAATIRYDTSAPGFNAKPEMSLRNNYAVDRSQIKDRKPLEYENLRDDDNVWSEFLWREIDAREKINQSFMYPGKDNAGDDQRFYSILLKAINEDSVTAFDPENDRFTKPLTTDAITSMGAGVADTVDVPDPVTGTVERVVTRKPRFSPDSVYTFRIKEQMIFDKEASRMFTRIIGIAPIAKQQVAGKSVARVLFWVYYPDLRRTLAKADVYNPKNFSSRMTWEELFESRYFSSYIIKSSANNPGDRYLNAMINDPLFRLLEGDNIKTRIFNWEQDLWQY
jgi:gliding motility associated protien GldN